MIIRCLDFITSHQVFLYCRILKPYIRQDYSTEPPKLKLLREIEQHEQQNLPTEGRGRGVKEVDRRHHPINYSYIQPKHVTPVNRLARTFFWPGIDVGEWLNYPDFTCVVTYKELVIAFAFLVPDYSHTEAYISYIFTHPEWRRHGIARFMLYHLIQTCMGKDIVLHVSATNPATFLYLKFGFKSEEIVNNFYENYHQQSNEDSKHALFLRLSR
jgi:ribosomal protein S18 acetylase RimI-like enzyme